MPRTIETTRFGSLTINDEEIVSFPRGIPGFETHTEWVLAGEDENPVKWLQSLSDSEVALPVTHPSVFMGRYAPRFADEDLEEVRCGSDEGLMLLVILSIPEGRPWEMTANIRAPIVLQHIRRVGKQIICLNEEYSVRQSIFSQEARSVLEQQEKEPQEKRGASSNFAEPCDEAPSPEESSRRKDAC